MGDPDALLDAVRDKLRAIPGLVTLVGGNPAVIGSYSDDNTRIFQALIEMGTPAILLGLQDSDFGELGNSRYEYTIIAWMRGVGRIGTAFKAICGGIAAGDTEPFSDTQIHPDFMQLGLPTIRRELDDDGIEYLGIAMRFQDRTNG